MLTVIEESIRKERMYKMAIKIGNTSLTKDNIDEGRKGYYRFTLMLNDAKILIFHDNQRRKEASSRSQYTETYDPSRPVVVIPQMERGELMVFSRSILTTNDSSKRISKLQPKLVIEPDRSPFSSPYPTTTTYDEYCTLLKEDIRSKADVLLEEFMSHMISDEDVLVTDNVLESYMGCGLISDKILNQTLEANDEILKKFDDKSLYDDLAFDIIKSFIQEFYLNLGKGYAYSSHSLMWSSMGDQFEVYHKENGIRIKPIPRRAGVGGGDFHISYSPRKYPDSIDELHKKIKNDFPKSVYTNGLVDVGKLKAYDSRYFDDLSNLYYERLRPKIKRKMRGV